MGIKSLLTKPAALWFGKRLLQASAAPVKRQRQVLEYLLRQGRKTQFGRDHSFDKVRSYEDLRKAVPVRDYEALRPYIERIIDGEKDVLWPGRPTYFNKTSGTTSGVKYIPLTRESLPCHIFSARNALMMHAYRTGNTRFFDGKMMFLSGSPVLGEKGGIPTGRLSGIVHHHVPAWLLKNRLPGWEVNCIEDWETKLDKVIDETLGADMRLISGIPPWVQMYFERVRERTGKTMKQVWPNFEVMVHGGVNFSPYRAALQNLIGGKVDFIETFPASEGFIAFQDIPEAQQETEADSGLLLLVDNGMFYEFIPAEDIGKEQPRRLPLAEVETGQNYALILHTNAGLWGYDIGDIVQFVSTKPYRLKVTGRTAHFISAFGEHVIAGEVEKALMTVARKQSINVIEFTVAPHVGGEGKPSYHEWFVEFADEPPADLATFGREVDRVLQRLNPYYEDLIKGNILSTLQVRMVKHGGFRAYMKAAGKLGGQNKVPRLANDRRIADDLRPWVVG